MLYCDGRQEVKHKTEFILYKTQYSDSTFVDNLFCVQITKILNAGF
jgi:hypothetical protein